MKNARDSRRELGRSPSRVVVLMAAVGIMAWSTGAPGAARAEEPVTPPQESGAAPETTPIKDTMPSFGEGDPETAAPSTGGHRYVAEIVDSVFVVGAAEFLALDLPPNPPDARAVHLLGTVTVADRKGDILVRLFRGPEYQNWLKKRGGVKSNAFWASKRNRSITLDQDLPSDAPIVVLLDNGYSMRTPKRIRTQLQIQYEFTDGRGSVAVPARSDGRAPEDDFITPRANTEEELPPPPPPPPDEGTD